MQNQRYEKLYTGTADDIFQDPAARRNIVGLFDLLLKIDRRNNPELYDPQRNVEKKKRNKKS